MIPFTVDGRQLLDKEGRVVAEFASDRHSALAQYVACAVNRNIETTALHTEMCLRYSAGEAARSIADDLGMSVGRVYQVLHANGIVVRSRGAPGRSPSELLAIEDMVKEMGTATAVAKALGVTRQRVSQIRAHARKLKETH